MKRGQCTMERDLVVVKSEVNVQVVLKREVNVQVRAVLNMEAHSIVQKSMEMV